MLRGRRTIIKDRERERRMMTEARGAVEWRGSDARILCLQGEERGEKSKKI